MSMTYVFIGTANSQGKEGILILGVERQKFWLGYNVNGKEYSLTEMINSIDIGYSDNIYCYCCSENVKNTLKELHLTYRTFDLEVNSPKNTSASE